MCSSKIILASLLILGTAVPMGAQENPASSPDSVALRNECRLARQVLVHGQPANKRQWALGTLQLCGAEGADVVAHQLRATRTAHSRTPELDALAAAGTMVIDREIYEAAREVAVDGAAGEAARVHAIGIWFTQVTGGERLPFEALTSDPARGGELIVGPIVSVRPSKVRRLPADALVSSAAALEQLLTSESNPLVVPAARQVFASFEYRIEDPDFFRHERAPDSH